ncbi:MAG: hypothetical protein ACREAA_00610 [Candidatus Polarisedimenticolia bacterium]
MPTTNDRHVRLKGHQVAFQTNVASSGRYRCLVMMLDPFDERHGLRVFKGYGTAPMSAENEALSNALQYLDLPGTSAPLAALDRLSVSVLGRRVDIFCDQIGPGRFQAFPSSVVRRGTRSSCASTWTKR